MMKFARIFSLLLVLLATAACQSESYEARFASLKAVPPKIEAQSCDSAIGQLAQEADENVPFLLEQLVNTEETDHFSGRVMFRRGDFADYVLSTRFGLLKTYGLDGLYEERAEAFYSRSEDALLEIFQQRQDHWRGVTEGKHGSIKRVECFK